MRPSMSENFVFYSCCCLRLSVSLSAIDTFFLLLLHFFVSSVVLFFIFVIFFFSFSFANEQYPRTGERFGLISPRDIRRRRCLLIIETKDELSK